MLFNSYEFIFLFLPAVLIGFHLMGRAHGHLYACGWLVVCSLIFYAWWNPAYIVLMVFSILFNYQIGEKTHQCVNPPHKKLWLITGVITNLALLGYYKYTNFFVDAVNDVAGTHIYLADIMLPLGISFFTFTQIAYLVDVYRGVAVERSLVNYFLFVTYFPHLIAGPVLHHKEMMPQFACRSDFTINYQQLSLGVTIFVIGLFKKVVLADSVAVYVAPVFSAASQGAPLHFFEAWGGALSYTLQLYFDFSGYSDMAVGLSFMLGIRLPMNFFSPYKSRNIVEFWRRWHMTLSRFLRDYLYIPLGGNRHGEINRYKNLFATMLLGGLWHGAAWTFVIWGAFHGVLLAICHVWAALVQNYRRWPLLEKIMKPLAYTMTFIAVVVGWVFFRADSFDSALIILKGMSGLSGIYLDPGETKAYTLLAGLGLPVEYSTYAARFITKDTLHTIIVLLFIVWCMPNVYQLTVGDEPVLDESGFLQTSTQSTSFLVRKGSWVVNKKWLVATVIMMVVVIMNLNQVSEFLYFRF